MAYVAEDTSLQAQLETELALVHATQQGDIQAYQQLYSMHVNKVYSLAYRLTGEHGMAEDATQEVFIQLWQKIGGFAGNSRFSTWLYSVASNVTITYMRKQKSWLQRVFSQETVVVPEPSTQDSTVNLDQLIIKLPEQARIVFVLHALEGRRHEDIATTLNIASGTSKAQFHRAKTLLQEWMNDAE